MTLGAFGATTSATGEAVLTADFLEGAFVAGTVLRADLLFDDAADAAFLWTFAATFLTVFLTTFFAGMRAKRRDGHAVACSRLET